MSGYDNMPGFEKKKSEPEILEESNMTEDVEIKIEKEEGKENFKASFDYNDEHYKKQKFKEHDSDLYNNEVKKIIAFIVVVVAIAVVPILLYYAKVISFFVMSIIVLPLFGILCGIYFYRKKRY